MKQLLPFIIVILFFVIIAILIIAMLNYRLKKRILEAGPINESTVQMLSALASYGTEALKWGLILFFAGLGLIVLEYIPFSGVDSPLPYGVLTIFIAIGFLTYYLIVQAKKGKQP
ncbi:hypothetical protein H9X96_06285 [Pedobacter sp. N36a]|uniref:DUF6249 domain-containing protein n=1 Tax=Pedobacter sp. N36a TaxID=2767996 RepID=UPI001656F2FF|nr:DUF6249 domain-containing protein [Pedobacter sp. N36a]MBC8985378.1 hypothetical protein [Pedobacter sp. N36a]